jgi:hypothetical protein
MQPQVIVKPDKNLYLFYSMLNTLHLNQEPVGKNPSNLHPLKEETIAHFQGYSDPDLNLSNYKKIPNPLNYILTLNEAPDFSQKDIDWSNSGYKVDWKNSADILPFLKRFYEITDFENFYQSIFPKYQSECNQLQNLVDESNIIALLDDAWEETFPLPMEIIPMPLEKEGSGHGPRIGDITYQIVGPPFEKRTLQLIAHEGSHPRAAKILKPISNEIRKRDFLFYVYKLHPVNLPNPYRRWTPVFTEHFIRALQAYCLDPALTGTYTDCLKRDLTIENRLRWQEYRGMVFIRDFYDEIRKYKLKHTQANLAEVGITILKQLDIKYAKYRYLS